METDPKFIQVLADAMNAMVTIPEEFKSFGHDYRDDTLAFVGAAYDFPEISPEQEKAVHETLVRRELDRAARIKSNEIKDEPSAPSDSVAGSIQ